MLEPYQDQLASIKILLASESPRRRDLLAQLGLKFLCQKSDYDESLLNPADFETKGEFVMNMAKKKVEHIRASSVEIGSDADLIIGADTIVVMDGIIYGKPSSNEKAAETLRMLSGKRHEVYTGVALLWSKKLSKLCSTEDDVDCFYTQTFVNMTNLTDGDIEAYIRTGEPLDKAGGYGIQGLGSTFVEWINGDFYNVVGFPIHDFCTHVRSRLDRENLVE